MSNAKSYKDEWVKIREIGQGGQGTTLKVQNLKDRSIEAVVKTLNRQKDSDRRARMHRESTSLATLNHPNITRYLDSNSQFFKEEDYNLFIITEFIDGPTLSEINFLEYQLPERIELFRVILETLNYSHKHGIIHRDIKPDNIILRNGRFNDPVLLDFGLSFNNSAKDDDNLTPDGEQLGNRFLLLPEQKTGETSKRDYKSDIACAVGLFFYFLTGKQPVVLLDEHNRKPHQKEEAKEILAKIPSHQLDVINNIFDVGFEQLIDRRWQTIQSLIDQLDLLEKVKPEEALSPKSFAESIKAMMNRTEYQNKKNMREIFSLVNTVVQGVIESVTKELGRSDWGSISGYFELTHEVFKHRIAPHNAVSGYSGQTIVHSYVTGSELVVRIIEGDTQKEVFRQPLAGDLNFDQFAAMLREHYLKQIEKSMM